MSEPFPNKGYFLVLSLLLASCGDLAGEYHWGTVIGVSPDEDKMGCFGDLPRATIQLDDGRISVKCMDAPIGHRVQVCLGTCDIFTTPRGPDPQALPNQDAEAQHER